MAKMTITPIRSQLRLAVPHELVFFQTKELLAYDSDTIFLNNNSHKAFKRLAKRIFIKCPEIQKRANYSSFNNLKSTYKVSLN